MNLDIDKGDGSPDTIRRFVDLDVQAAVDRAVERLTRSDKRVAAVVVADKDKASVAFMARLGKGWSVMTVADRKWNGEAEFQAVLQWSA